MIKTFAVFRSSAGSGKTRTLAKEYLRLALRYPPDYYRHVLAVTFTNKATQEMKNRILQYLDSFAAGNSSDLSKELMNELQLEEKEFVVRSRAVLSSILHDYGQFSISTIDAFFQRVIRSFMREAELMGDYRLELDQDAALREVIDNLMDNLGDDPELTKWVVDFANDSLENERAWDVRTSLVEFSKELFKDGYKVTHHGGAGEEVRSKFKSLMQHLNAKKNAFLSHMRRQTKEVLDRMNAEGLTVGDFKWGASGGPMAFFLKINAYTSVGAFEDFGARSEGFRDARNWPAKSGPKENAVFKLAQQYFVPAFESIVAFRDEQFADSYTAEVVLDNLYSFGLLHDIAKELRLYKVENNVMLLADAPEFLNGVIGDSDTPFVYEKVGSYYRNFLIDEFQDTSLMQWKNFLPLVSNSLDQGYSSAIVGDPKQAIYRWRGGDLRLLQEDVQQQIGVDRTDSVNLDSNYRSVDTIVGFNNSLFAFASSSLASMTVTSLPSFVYQDVNQHAVKHEAGLVSVEFIPGYKNDWKAVALDRVPQWLELLQDEGVEISDIGILVRKNDEGQEIISHLLKYKESESARPDCRYDVVSNESLRLDTASSVNLLVAAMRYLLNPADGVSRAQLAYEYHRTLGKSQPFTETFAVSEQTFFESFLPDTFTRNKAQLRKLPLYELAETLIQIFDLGTNPGELTYLQSFQDEVLRFYSRERNDLGLFMEWWDENKNKKSIVLSGEVKAAQILTIHKAKGLQFKYVLIPFCSWNMDHDSFRSPFIWKQLEGDAYELVGAIPVRYKSGLKATLFKDEYERERESCILDNLNLLYVAFTRAECGLFIAAPENETKPKTPPGSVAALLFNCLSLSDELKMDWIERDILWRRGEIQKVEGIKIEHSSAIKLDRFISSRWRDRLVIRSSATGFFDDDRSLNEQARHGLFVHRVLSGIEYKEDIDRQLRALLDDGTITTHDEENLRNRLNELMADAQIASWFSKPWKVLTEVPILLPEGIEKRIDRLLVLESRAVIIDFKTGEPHQQDKRQVSDYMATLRQMNFTQVEGYLLYLSTSNVVVVETGKAKALKTRDKKQLDLGF